MRVVMTGGSGLIGSALVRSLAADGHEVIVLSRAPERMTGLPGGVRAERWDGKTAEGWAALADGADAIVNLAGESIAGSGILEILFGRWTAARKRAIRDSRRDAGLAIVDAVQRAVRKPKVVIQSSAVGYYGVTHDTRCAEDDAPGNDFLASVCVDWEASTAPIEAMGVRRAITRSGVVQTPSGGILSMLLLPYRLFVGGRLGSGRQWYPWIHIEDEINAIRFLIDQPQARGPFNLTATHQLRNTEVAAVVARTLRRPAWLPIPGFALRALLAEKSILILEGQLAPPDRLLSLGFVFRHPQFEGALRDLLA